MKIIPQIVPKRLLFSDGLVIIYPVSYTHLNKQKIEELYEHTRTEMLDIWEIIDYPKRNEFVRPKIQAAIADMKKFTVEDKLVMIPFFDPLINALYDLSLIHIFAKSSRSFKAFAGRSC